MNASLLPDIRQQTPEALAQWLSQAGQPAFRARQLNKWLWQTPAESFDGMTDMPASLRKQLAEAFGYPRIILSEEHKSADGTIKMLFRLHDGHQVEGVLIPAGQRMTACISSQVGCSLACKFCATGRMDMERNLTAPEIFDQVLHIGRVAEWHYGQPLSHIVYMGMGEPLLNYRPVLASFHLLTSPEGQGMSPRRITISTAGIAKMIARLGDDGYRGEFALSLHAATDEKRSQMMEINDSNNLETLTQALRHFYDKTRTRVTYEYICFQDFNDGLDDAAALLQFVRRVPSKVNIIEYNPIGDVDYRFTSAERLDRFTAYLEQHGVIVNVRRSRGRDVNGACGQLALQTK